MTATDEALVEAQINTIVNARWLDTVEKVLLHKDIRALCARVEKETLERAARAAECAGRPVGGGDGDTYISGSALDAANAIRALPPKYGDGA